MADDEFDFEFDLIGDQGGEEEADVGAIKGNLESGDWAEAAMLFELSPAGTADVILDEIKSAPEDTKQTAAKMFAEARDFSSAGSALADIGDIAGAAEQFARQGAYYEAAKLYRELQDAHQEVAQLQQVPANSPDRLPAVDRLSDLMVEHGYLADAAQLLTDTMRELADKQAGIGLAAKLAPMLKRLDKNDEAQAVQAWLDQQTPTLETLEPEPEPPPPESSPLAPPDGVVASTATPVEQLTSLAPPPPKKRKNPIAYRTLKSIPMFAELSIVDMKDLYRLCEEKRFAAGESLLTAGESGGGLYAIVEGEAEVTNKDRQLDVATTGDYLGEMGLVRSAPASADVTATTEVVALFMERTRFEAFLRTRPDAAARIWRLFCQTLADRVATLSN